VAARDLLHVKFTNFTILVSYLRRDGYWTFLFSNKNSSMTKLSGLGGKQENND